MRPNSARHCRRPLVQARGAQCCRVSRASEDLQYIYIHVCVCVYLCVCACVCIVFLAHPKTCSESGLLLVTTERASKILCMHVPLRACCVLPPPLPHTLSSLSPFLSPSL
jgi:hypothetical protein